MFLKNWLNVILCLMVSNANAEYQSYGMRVDTDYLLIPETHIWRENPRIWTVKKYFSDRDKFSLVYALQEADCKKNKLRYRSQTWVLRESDQGDELLTDSSIKR